MELCVIIIAIITSVSLLSYITGALDCHYKANASRAAATMAASVLGDNAVASASCFHRSSGRAATAPTSPKPASVSTFALLGPTPRRVATLALPFWPTAAAAPRCIPAFETRSCPSDVASAGDGIGVAGTGVSAESDRSSPPCFDSPPPCWRLNPSGAARDAC